MKPWMVVLAAWMMTGAAWGQAQEPAYRTDPYYVRASQLYRAAAAQKAYMEADPRAASNPLQVRRLEQTAREAARLFVVLQRRHPAHAALFRARAEECAQTSRSALTRLIQLLGGNGQSYGVRPSDLQAAAANLPALARHRAAFQQSRARIEREHNSLIQPIEREYRALLNNLLVKAERFNNPVIARAAREELQRLNRADGAPGRPSSALDVRELQTGYARGRAPVDRGRKREMAELVGQYDRVLAQMEKDLARAKKKDEVALVQIERRDLARIHEAEQRR